MSILLTRRPHSEYFNPSVEQPADFKTLSNPEREDPALSLPKWQHSYKIQVAGNSVEIRSRNWFQAKIFGWLKRESDIAWLTSSKKITFAKSDFPNATDTQIQAACLNVILERKKIGKEFQTAVNGKIRDLALATIGQDLGNTPPYATPPLAGRVTLPDTPLEIDADLLRHASVYSLLQLGGLLFPSLLKELSTNEIIGVLSRKDGENRSLIQSLSVDAVNHLAPTAILRLISILSKMGKVDLIPQLHQPYAQEYLHILQNRSPRDHIARIKELPGLSDDEKLAAVAHYMEHSKIPLRDIYPNPTLSRQECLKLAAHLRYVDLDYFSDTTFASEFLNKCSVVNYLHIDNTIAQNVRLPSILPVCERFDCAGCERLSRLPELPLCKYLICSNCPALSQLPELPLCQTLRCYNCTALSQLPELPLCQELDCFNCPALSQFPELPLCQKLYCSFCPALSQLPELPLCQHLSCSNCTALSQLPELPLCQKLDCHNCPALSQLPELPLCQTLYCSHCRALSRLPQALPVCISLDCRGCPIGQLPQMPWNVTVHSIDDAGRGIEHISLNVDVDRLNNDPLDLLLQLGDQLLKGKPFPSIYYSKNGQRSEGIDAGGLRRDFLSRLSMRLFQQGESPEDAANFLLLNQGMPTLSSSSDRSRQEKGYRTLGALFAQCYPKDSYFKLGGLFPDALYACLITPGGPTDDQWWIANYLTLTDTSDAVKEVIRTKSVEGVPLSEADLQSLSFLIDITGAHVYTQQDLSNEEKKRELLTSLETVGSNLLVDAKAHLSLQPIAWIAEEMINRVGKLENESAVALKDRIEGVISDTALKNHLRWVPQGSVTEDQVAKVRNYLHRWIDGHPSKKDLERFVLYVSGNRTLCPKKLKMEVYNREPGILPIAHTCFFSLELTANCPDQETFNEKLDRAIEEGLAETGFTFG